MLLGPALRCSGGEFGVKDLGSTTGTFFYLPPHGHFQMFPGLMVKLGETEMQVLSQSSSELTVLFTEGSQLMTALKKCLKHLKAS